MKNTLYFNLLLFMAVCFATGWFSGCKDEIEPIWVVTATQGNYTFEAVGGDSVMPVISNQPWTASLAFDDDEGGWASLSSAGNNTDEVVILQVDTNFTSKARTVTVIFESPGREPVVFDVLQKAAALKITGATGSEISSANITAHGGSSKVIVASLVAWTFSKPEADSWYSVTREGDSLTVVIQPNLRKESRASEIKLMATGFPNKLLKVEQEKAKINVTVDGATVKILELGYAGIDKELEVDCPIEWTIVDKTFEEWIPSLTRRADVDEADRHIGILDIKTWANPYYMERSDSVQLAAAGLDTVTIKLRQKPTEMIGTSAERSQALSIWDPDNSINSLVMKQGTSSERKKQFTYTLKDVKANTRLTITFQNRIFGNASMFGAVGNGEIDAMSGSGSGSRLQYAFVPYVSSETDIVHNADGSWTFDESVITPWTIKQAGNYDIMLELKDALDAESYITFTKRLNNP